MRWFSLFVGLRYAGARRRAQLVSFISGISILGLMVGVGLLLTVLSVMNGFEKELKDRILGIMPHGAIYHRYGVDDWLSLKQRLEANPSIQAAAPFVELQAMLSVGRKVKPAGLYGIDVAAESQVSVINQFVDESVFSQLAIPQSSDSLKKNTAAPNDENDVAVQMPGIILGKGLAESLSVSVGDRITVLVPNGQGRRALPKYKSLKLVGVINSGTELDFALALMDLETASALSDFPGRVSGLRVKTANLFEAPSIIHDQVRAMEYGHYGSDWTRTHGNLFHAVQMSKNLVGLLLFLIVAIAAFNVVSTLVMVVVDKQSDIAILKTLGASRSDIMAVFMVQGCVIGALGTGLGVVFGLLGSVFAQDLVAFIEQLFHVSFLNAEIYPVSYLPSQVQWPDFVLVSVVSLLMSLLATVYPAWRASRIEPADALRYE